MSEVPEAYAQAGPFGGRCGVPHPLHADAWSYEVLVEDHPVHLHCVRPPASRLPSATPAYIPRPSIISISRSSRACSAVPCTCLNPRPSTSRPNYLRAPPSVLPSPVLPCTPFTPYPRYSCPQRLRPSEANPHARPSPTPRPRPQQPPPTSICALPHPPGHRYIPGEGTCEPTGDPSALVLHRMPTLDLPCPDFPLPITVIFCNNFIVI